MATAGHEKGALPGSQGGEWLVDGGSNANITPFSSDFLSLEAANSVSSVILGNGQRLSVEGMGTCRIGLEGDQTIDLFNVLFVPQFNQRIISVFMLLLNGYEVNFSPRDLSCTITKNGVVVVNCRRSENLWFAGRQINVNRHVNHAVTADLWHLKFNHLNEQGLKLLCTKNMVNGMDVQAGGNTFHKDCIGCNSGKQTTLPPAARSGFQAKNKLQLVPTDLLDINFLSVHSYRTFSCSLMISLVCHGYIFLKTNLIIFLFFYSGKNWWSFNQDGS